VDFAAHRRGIVAITVGLFQFFGSLRDAYPAVNRAMGYLYLSAVFLAGCAGFELSPDTPVFAAHGLTDLTAIDLSTLGLSPSFLGYSASSRLIAALAFARARQRRFDEQLSLSEQQIASEADETAMPGCASFRASPRPGRKSPGWRHCAG
jgi:hypothetical protein